MGRVVIQATVENFGDLWEARKGRISESSVRRIVVDDALVDTDATTLSLPKRLVRELGLEQRSRKAVTSSTGLGEAGVYDPVRLTIQGRECTVDVLEVPDSVPALIGQIPLEMLDLVVDLRNRRLIANPEHGGEHIIELYVAT